MLVTSEEFLDFVFSREIYDIQELNKIYDLWIETSKNKRLFVFRELGVGCFKRILGDRRTYTHNELVKILELIKGLLINFNETNLSVRFGIVFMEHAIRHSNYVSALSFRYKLPFTSRREEEIIYYNQRWMYRNNLKLVDEHGQVISELEPT